MNISNVRGLNPLKNGAVFRRQNATGGHVGCSLNPLKNGAVFRLRECQADLSGERGLNPLKNGAVFRLDVCAKAEPGAALSQSPEERGGLSTRPALPIAPAVKVSIP